MPTIYNLSDSNKRKSFFLLSGFFLLVIAIGAVFGMAMNDSSIIVGAVIFSIVSSFASYWWSDKIVLAMSQARPVSQETDRELYRLVENLCIAGGLPVPRIYVIEDTAMNAFATGRDPEHAAIVFTTGILSRLERIELEGVIAHELSHIGNRDILLATLVTVLVGVVVLLADWFRHIAFWGGRKSNEDSNKGGLGLIIMIAAIILSILAPLFAYMMQFAISRKREFLADADGALLTRYPEGLARALEKISGDTEPLEAANRATAHLYIASPFKSDVPSGKPGFFARAFMTHPPIEERIAALRNTEA
jgi:heat shock protein HtpX